jgi:hypothetical protein
MIVFKDTKGFQTRSDVPNENWTENEKVFVIHDQSELAQKIKQSYPYFEFVLDEEGNLIDVTPTEPPPQPPSEPSELDVLKEKVRTQDAVIEELLFSIIPQIGGGM